MDRILLALADQHAELDGLLSGLDDDGWNGPSACAGWSISDVMLHLAQTDEMAIASLEGRFGEALAQFASGMSAGSVDDGAGQMVERERGAPPAAVHERWKAGTRALRDALGRRTPRDRVDWVAGQLSAQTLATTRMTEAWIHTGDVAHGLGVTLSPTDRLRDIARLARRTLPVRIHARLAASSPGRSPSSCAARTATGGPSPATSPRPPRSPATRSSCVSWPASASTHPRPRSRATARTPRPSSTSSAPSPDAPTGLD